MIYDCFTFRDELDILEIRLNVLNDVVDKFVICEADKTFTNQPKPYIFLQNIDRFSKWIDKISYLPITLEDEGLDFSKNDSSYTPTSAAWQFEYQQRSALIYGLNEAQPNDLILMGDLDEIPNPLDIKDYGFPVVYAMDFFYYFVNNKSIGPRDKTWLGTAQINGSYLSKLENLQELRNIKNNFHPIKSGWHLSYMGGKELIQTKIKSFSHTEYNQEKYYSDENINNSLLTGKDIFGREGMNFEIINLSSYYPQNVIDTFKNYPSLIYETIPTN